jgi:hypothetical protein
MSAPRNNLEDQLKRLNAEGKVSRSSGPLMPASQIKVRVDGSFHEQTITERNYFQSRLLGGFNLPSHLVFLAKAFPYRLLVLLHKPLEQRPARQRKRNNDRGVLSTLYTLHLLLFEHRQHHREPDPHSKLRST